MMRNGDMLTAILIGASVGAFNDGYFVAVSTMIVIVFTMRFLMWVYRGKKDD